MALSVWSWAVTFAALALAQDNDPSPSIFNMYPAVNTSALASILGWSTDCVTAMNTTLPCDQDTFRMAGQIDLYYWSLDNVTTLCTDACLSNVTNWYLAIEDACAGETYNVASKLVPVDLVAMRFVSGLNMACLQPDNLPMNFTGNINNTFAALVDNADNSTYYNSTYLNETLFDPPTVDIDPTPDYANQSYVASNTTDEDPLDAQGPTWCFLESQLWQAIDPQPDCELDPGNVFCTDPSSMNRLANLYFDEILCDPCFLTVMWWRINSLLLPDSDYSDYLIEQYQDITDVCQIQMPDSVVRALPNYPDAPNATYSLPGTDPLDNVTMSYNCTGQIIQSSSQDCDDLSQKYGVTTGDVQSITGTDDCSFQGTVCVPSACSLQQVNTNTTCDELASSYSTSNLNVTTSLFLQWNANIQGLCDDVAMGQYICSGPPGGTYNLPPPVSSTNYNATGQQRGGQGGDTNPNGPNGPNGPTANSTAFAPTQPGIDPSCNAFAYASSGDTCYGFTQSYGISMANLTQWNPALGYPDGHNCTTQFWLGYDYCVGVPGSNTTIPSSTTSSRAPISTAPSPTQSGIASNCNAYAKAQQGDGCYEFAQEYNITTDQLYTWNSVLGSGGANCNTEFQAGEYYCIGVSGGSSTATSTTSSTTALAYPTQSGIAANCDLFKNAISGDYCSKFASDNNITPDQLYAWNTILGPNGANCSTEFQAGYDYCIGISATSTTSSPTTTSPTASAIPTQSGIDPSCDDIVEAQSGDYCYQFAQENDITTDQLYEWNTILGPNGANCSTEFQAGYGYCVAVSS